MCNIFKKNKMKTHITLRSTSTCVAADVTVRDCVPYQSTTEGTCQGRTQTIITIPRYQLVPYDSSNLRVKCVFTHYEDEDETLISLLF